jgi:hypothetical protein
VITLKRSLLGVLALSVLIPAAALPSAAPTPAKQARAKHATLSGVWRGEYSYGDGAGQGPVKFVAVLIQDGNKIVGLIKEPNTFGNQPDPWLHAGFKGTFDRQAGKVTGTKTYDGTGGQDHDVEYSGKVTRKGTRIEGTWNIGQAQGSFTLERVPVKDGVLTEGLK